MQGSSDGTVGESEHLTQLCYSKKYNLKENLAVTNADDFSSVEAVASGAV